MDSMEKKRIRNEVMARGLLDPSLAFSRQRANAKTRGIEWQMTFGEWWEVWRDYYHLRGKGINHLLMAREGDTGPYAVGNVHLTTGLGNLLEYQRSEKRRAKTQAARVANYEKKCAAIVWQKKVYQPNTVAHTIKAKEDWDTAIERANNENC